MKSSSTFFSGDHFPCIFSEIFKTLFNLQPNVVIVALSLPCRPTLCCTTWIEYFVYFIVLPVAVPFNIIIIIIIIIIIL